MEKKGQPVICKLVLAVTYWREYRPMRQMGLDYDVPKSTVCDAIKWVEVTLSKWDKIIKFDFNSWPMPLSGKIVMYICPKCKCKIEVPIEAAKEWEEEDMWNGKDKSIPLYGECTNCNYKKTVPIDYIGTRGYHYIYKKK